ncbi:hypothetical protein NP493_466g05043 [Ridgeia piscesae]|uniref:Golgi SNAP receptor complex member 2 n=1 Tax=Ridgeia piscesae TaxID=27915 RepID=A0AAD9KYW9_RIDPI|nr:hypothetical protein NP493_466g05043 [Ridgeia piscesae]
METLYHQTHKMVQEVQNGFGRLEGAPDDGVHLIENELQAQIDQVVTQCERLDLLVNKEPPTRRANAKIRVDQLKRDCQHLQFSIRNVQHRRYQREQELREREALMSSNFAPNDANTTIMMDAALQQNTRLTNVHRDMDDMLTTGSYVMSNLRDQHSTLKGAHRKILDVANTLGLSNTVLRLIERRAYQDKYVLFGGMILSCVIMWLVWKYFT